MTSHTAHFYPSQPVRHGDAEQCRIGAAFRATFWAAVSVLALVCALSFTHGRAAPAEAQPVSEAYGWPI
jgi:hypothetical protein